jgi:hypothetical protein
MSAAAPAVQRFYGKYRGTVVNNIDPMQMGRVQVLVPDVSGDLPASWAMPCVPVAGINSGVFTLPPVGSGVWIEFEHGDPDYPIWRTMVPGLDGFTVQTTEANGLVVSDVPGPTGGVLLTTATGATISISDVGIVISNGRGATISLIGPTVDINTGALTVV